MFICKRYENTWLMRLNIAKCKVMHVGRGEKSQHEYTMRDNDGNRSILETTQVEQDLGILVSDDLKLEAQCQAAVVEIQRSETSFLFTQQASLGDPLKNPYPTAS